jgi:hypothetical protein
MMKKLNIGKNRNKRVWEIPGKLDDSPLILSELPPRQTPTGKQVIATYRNFINPAIDRIRFIVRRRLSNKIFHLRAPVPRNL